MLLIIHSKFCKEGPVYAQIDQSSGNEEQKSQTPKEMKTKQPPAEPIELKVNILKWMPKHQRAFESLKGNFVTATLIENSCWKLMLLHND